MLSLVIQIKTFDLRTFGICCTHSRFAERVKGGHHIFSRDGVSEIVNLQPLPGGKAKAYQVRQVRGIITSYKLSIP